MIESIVLSLSIGSLVVIIIVIVILSSRNRYTRVDYPRLFNYTCSDSTPCEEGLVCDSVYGLCKYPDGHTCNNSYSCSSDSYCNEVCTPIADMSANGTCPCDYNTQGCLDGLCKSTTTCTIGSDCLTGMCYSGVCSNFLANGSRCGGDTSCISGNCSDGICQPFNVNTGDLGSYCNNASCIEPLRCISGTCQL